MNLGIETIGSRFGGIPSTLPAPALPSLSWSRIVEVLPSAFTIAFLVGVESLLSAVAADAVAGTRVRPNAEVLGQGIANVASPLFGGMPATGVIARTGTNIQAGAKTPVSGVLHALFILIAMLALAPLAAHLALPCLAAVLITTAWRLIDAHELRVFVRRAPRDDIIVLAATFLLTILVDLNVAIAVGVVLASILFMHRMAETSGIDVAESADDHRDDAAPQTPSIAAKLVPPGVKLLDFSGPLFYGQSARMVDVLERFSPWPRVLILRMRDVPLIDATAIGTLDQIASDCRKHGCRIIISAIQPQPRAALHRYGFLREHRVILTSNSYVAIEKAKLLALSGVDGTDMTSR
jgi:SulP family sulfate permease